MKIIIQSKVYRYFVIGWCIAVFLLSGLILFFKHSKPISKSTLAPVAMDVSEMHAVWVSSTQAILADYDKNQNAKSARDRLLALTVTAADKGRHLELVLAFEHLANNDLAGLALLKAARKGF